MGCCLFALFLTTRAAATAAEDAPDVEAFYAQQAPPPATDEAAILVVQADGTGVPILRPRVTAAPVRLGKGQKHGGKKEATLTATYTIAPATRTREAVVESLFAAAGAAGPARAAPPERTGPQGHGATGPAPVGDAGRQRCRADRGRRAPRGATGHTSPTASRRPMGVRPYRSACSGSSPPSRLCWT